MALIERKRDGGKLSVDEIGWLIDSYTKGIIPDYQMSAMLMAVFLRGLDQDELSAWVDAMLNSGERLKLSSVTRPKVDKHSTGGVGDKVSIPLGPMVAACGVAIPMVSGRGLAHTGGTLDKLETIPGFRTSIDPGDFEKLLAKTGVVFAGQSKTLAPADRKLYALRDATGTVGSIPLIASSIMSKKVAADLNGLVLDVKVGSGAFMKDLERARSLARTMVMIGDAYGVNTMALLTDMDTPIGREIGNANEIAESIQVLKGEGPDDLIDLSYALGGEMLIAAGLAADRADAGRQLREAVASGAALETFAGVIEAQGGDAGVIDSPSKLPRARHATDFTAQQAGTVTSCDALQLGLAAMALGAGRETKEDEIDPAVGITLLAKPGERVDEGQPLARVAWNDETRLATAVGILGNAWTIGEGAFDRQPLIKGEVRS